MGQAMMKHIPCRALSRAGAVCALVGVTAAGAVRADTGADVPVRRAPRAPQAVMETAPADLLAPARALYDEGRYEEALRLCRDVERAHPMTPGAMDLRLKCHEALLELRALEVMRRDEQSQQRMAIDALEARLVPDSFGRQQFSGDQSEPFFQGTPLSAVLDRPVSIHLQGANVGTFIETLARDEEINMIADQGLASDKQIHIEVNDVPLREILDFIARNYGINFYLGENIIWVTAADTGAAAPMQTRIYRLRKGLQHYGDDWGTADASATSDMGTISRRAGTLPEGETYITQIISMFVPEVPGAQLHLDRNTHTLIVRNTVENLQLVGRLVEALDVTPPQVLIEARFMEVTVSDLREVGLEWVLDSALVATQKGVMRDGQWVEEPRTLVDPGASVRYTPYASDDAGPFPLGPQGSFGSRRSGNPPTADQGLNLTYRGVLTEPMFQAILHALEVSGKGRTLSVPRVTTVNNHPAKLRDGDDLLYYKQFQAQAFQLVDASNQRYTVTALIPQGAPDTAELGITLVAVPSVGADLRSISLLLTPTISALDRFESYQDTGGADEPGAPQVRVQQVVVKLPVISRREVQTKVVVGSGETVVLGGLIRSVEQETVHRVPILGSLPLVGSLFRRTAVTEEKRNLLIFVTATVLSERGENMIPLPVSAEAGDL